MAIDIERLVSMKAYKFNIPGYDIEDIKQEIRMVAIKAISKFDITKNNKGPFWFIATSVDNYLINLRRDNDAVISKKKLAEADEKTLDRLEQKRKLYYPTNIDDAARPNAPGLEYTFNHVYDVHDEIILHIPSGLIKSYWLLVNEGSEAISKSHFTQLKKIIKDII